MANNHFVELDSLALIGNWNDDGDEGGPSPSFFPNEGVQFFPMANHPALCLTALLVMLQIDGWGRRTKGKNVITF